MKLKVEVRLETPEGWFGSDVANLVNEMQDAVEEVLQKYGLEAESVEVGVGGDSRQ